MNSITLLTYILYETCKLFNTGGDRDGDGVGRGKILWGWG